MDAMPRASALADRYWDETLELEPMLGTLVGDERFDDRLADPSEAGREKSRAVQQRALDEVEQIDRAELDAVLRTTLDVVEAIARRAMSDIENRLDRLSAASHLFGPANLVAELASAQSADTPERLDRYLSRLHAIPAYLAAVIEIVEEGPRVGVTSPRVVAERAVAQTERLLEIDAGETPALGPAGDDAAARERIVEAVRDVVNPAYQKYLEALRAYLPHATETIGVSALPGGEALYDAQILAWTTLPLGAQEVHDIGVARLSEIHEARREIAAQLGFESPADAVAAHNASGKNTAASRDELLELTRRQVERSWEVAKNFFNLMPSANCEVKLVEEFREADMPFAFYQSPTADGSRPGIYYVSAFDLPTRALHHLATTTYHEANPGHHFQISIEQEMRDRPALRRFGGILAGSAFAEGWGLYSERLADEMGLFADEYERLGMLDAQALRAVRLVTDTGIHALGWTREASIAALEEAGQPHTDAVIETDRYIAMPGQACSYMIGMIEIEKARDRAVAAGKPLKDFHDTVLGLGSLPLPSLRRELGFP
ncbi:MAG TPA: DUF885 domain-containing protein [Actinomycetota bacterium]|jgi:uncharacterized protein (DUF885 family)|nr:DUF885 domain-containing protein [Actinomycetota bacterium]